MVAFDESCARKTRVEDLGTRTLLISPVRAMILDPGQALEEALDVSAGLPSGRGDASVFATNPVVVSVHPRPVLPMMVAAADESLRYRLVGAHWQKIEQDFGFILAATPVASGTVVVDLVYAEALGPRLVPAGNVTRAWLFDSEGDVTELPNWPRTLTWQHHSTPTTIWATAVKPGQPGQFLLRLPLQGKATFAPIPGTAACRGDERLSQPALLDEVTDTGALVSLIGAGCVREADDGVYRFDAEGNRWTREGERPPWQRPEPWGKRVATGDTEVAMGDGEVVVTRAGTQERAPLVGLVPGTDDRKGDVVWVTANGREIWATGAVADRCLTFRYRWAPSAARHEPAAPEPTER